MPAAADRRSTSSSHRSGRTQIQTARGVTWAREAFALLKPYLARARYVNYLEDDVRDGAVVAYGPNLPRLRALKARFDPTNFFKQNVNISPE
jgi:FAD/FMN-containing dehydrogenase